MSPEQLVAIVLELADLRIERDAVRAQNARLQNDLQQLHGELTIAEARLAALRAE